MNKRRVSQIMLVTLTLNIVPITTFIQAREMQHTTMPVKLEQIKIYNGVLYRRPIHTEDILDAPDVEIEKIRYYTEKDVERAQEKVRELKKRLKKPTKKQIDRDIRKIDNIVKLQKKLRTVISGVIGGAGLATGAAIALSGVTKAIGAGLIATGFGVGLLPIPVLSEAGAFILMTLGMGSFITSEVVGIGAIAGVVGSFTGMSGAILWTVYRRTLELEKIEEKYPGTLTPEQKTVIQQFKNEWRGPIIRTILKGYQLKNLLKKSVEDTIKNNRKLVTIIGRKKDTKTIIKKYFLAKWQLLNITRALEKLETKREKYREKRAQESILSPIYHWQNLKLKVLTKPEQLMLKYNKKKLAKRITKLETAYPGLHKLLEKPMHDYMAAKNELLQQFAKVNLEKIAKQKES